MPLSLIELSPGDDIGTSEWLEMTQAQINAFADATHDHNWIHVDEEKCRSQSPFGTTIAHGFLSATLMPSVFYQMVNVDFSQYTPLNYGVDKIRFVHPVKCGDRICYRITLVDKQQKSSGLLYKFGCHVLIEGQTQPAMTGEYLVLLVPNHT